MCRDRDVTPGCLPSPARGEEILHDGRERRVGDQLPGRVRQPGLLSGRSLHLGPRSRPSGLRGIGAPALSRPACSPRSTGALLPIPSGDHDRTCARVPSERPRKPRSDRAGAQTDRPSGGRAHRRSARRSRSAWQRRSPPASSQVPSPPLPRVVVSSARSVRWPLSVDPRRSRRRPSLERRP